MQPPPWAPRGGQAVDARGFGWALRTAMVTVAATWAALGSLVLLADAGPGGGPGGGGAVGGQPTLRGRALASAGADGDLDDGFGPGTDTEPLAADGFDDPGLLSELDDSEEEEGHDSDEGPAIDAPFHQHLRHHLHPHQHKEVAVLVFLLHVALTFGIAFLLDRWSLRSPALGERPPEAGRRVLGYGLFDEKGAIGPDMQICVCSMACYSIQWADTLTKDKVSLFRGNFYLALLVSLLVFPELAKLTAMTARLVFVLIAVYFRQKLREKFGLEHGTVPTLAMDCASWLFFPWCTAAQEARQVEYFSTLGSRVFEDYGFSGGGAHPGQHPVVGGPVVVQGNVVRPGQAPPPDDSEDARE